MNGLIGKFIVLAIILFYGNSIAFANEEDQVALLTLSEVDTLLKHNNGCQIKQMASECMSRSALEKLFLQLEAAGDISHDAIWVRAKRINELMNEVFISEGEHSWGKDDMRVLYLMRAYWEQSIDPECFDEKIDDFPSEEWLNGAVWVRRQKE